MPESSAFAKVPAWLLAMKPPAYAVLLYAVLYLESDWTSHRLEMAHADMADQAGISLAQVKRMLKWLRDAGALSWEPHKEGKIQYPNIYTVVVDKGGVLSDPPVCESFRGGLTERHTSLTDGCLNRRAKQSRPVEKWTGGDDVYASPMEVVA